MNQTRVGAWISRFSRLRVGTSPPAGRHRVCWCLLLVGLLLALPAAGQDLTGAEAQVRGPGIEGGSPLNAAAPATADGEIAPLPTAAVPIDSGATGASAIEPGPGAPVIEPVAGEPTVAAVAGEPTVAAVAGEPTVAAVAGEPTVAAVAGEPDAVARVSPEAELLARWNRPGTPLAERVRSVQGTARRLGILDLDAPARALLLDASEGGALERAEAAVALAPHLPDAHLALAAARWQEERAVFGAIDEVAAAWAAATEHLEARLFLEVVLCTALALALILGALAFLFVAGLAVAPRAATRLASIVPEAPPGAVFALLAAAVLSPAVLGEGLVGVALVIAALAICFGGTAQRVAVVLAASALLVGLHPVLDHLGSALVAPGADPVAEAAQSVEAGLAPSLAVPRISHAASDDPFAARAMAMHARRQGDLAEADARYRELLASYEDPGLVNNAANVRFAIGEDDESIALYERAAALGADARIYFNLSQAYGRAIRLGEQDSALERAQALDPELVDSLGREMASLGGAYVIDVPLAVPTVRARLGAVSDAGPGAVLLRQRMAPGRVGVSLPIGAAIFFVLAALAVVVGIPLGAHAGDDDDFYAGIARLLQGRSATDPSLRVARIAALRQRRARHERVAGALAALVPGAAGVLGRRPFLGLIAALLFGVATVAWATRAGVVPDPISAGATAQFTLTVVACVAALLYVATTLVAWLARVKT